MRRIAQFDLNLLEVFEAIYSKGGVSYAARHLNLSQPAISHALARLRHAFDDRLFLRQGNRLIPTAVAHAIIEPVRDALRSVGIALLNATAFDPATSRRHFKIGFRLSGEVPQLARLAARVRALAPAVALASVNFLRRDMALSLANGDLDVALDVHHPSAASVQRQALGSEMLVIAARPGHPRIHGRIDLESYLALDHVFASPRSHGLGIEDHALAELGHERHVTIRCQHPLSAWEVVAASDLICTLPRRHAEALNRFQPLQLLGLPFVTPCSETYMFWHQSGQADPGLSWLRGLIAAQFAT